jgi:hypothetical protein
MNDISTVESGLIVSDELSNTNESEAARLKNQVKESGGKIRVWIHPYYMGDDRAYVPVMEKIVSKLDENKGVPNVFFMPDDSFFERDQKRILDKAARGGDRCYFVRTDIANPRPALDESNGIHAWDVLRNLFKEVGITECVVGGEYASGMEIASPETVTGSGCVNEAMDQLSVSFKVERSNVAFPVNRAEVNRTENKNK